MPLRQRFETLLLYDPNRSPATANVSISHPSPSEEQALGKMVIISTIAGNDRVNLDIIGLVQDELRTNYYQTVDAKPERAFEHALHQTNKRLHQVITDGIGAWVDQASILVAVIWRDTVIISSVGSMHAYLLRRNVRDGRVTFGMHSIMESGSGPINPVRIFPHTITGQLQADDQLLFCTPSLFDYFSLEKLRRTMADGQPEEAVHHWETTLLGVEQRSAFAAVIVQLQSFDTVAMIQSRPVVQATLIRSAPQVSMEHLIAKEEATERLLSPSIWPAIRDVMTQVWLGLSRFVRRIILRRPPRRILASGIQRPPSPVSSNVSRWSVIRRNIAGFFLGFVQVLRSIVPRKVQLPRPTPSVNLSPNLKTRWRPSLNGFVAWFQHLSRRQQGLSVLSVVLVVILAVAILPRASSSDRQSTATNNHSTIADELGKAKAALLYGGDETAAQNLAAARALYDQLPNRSGKDKAARQSALADITEVAELLAKVSKPTLTTVAQLATVSPQAQPQQLYLANKHLVTLDPDRSITIIADVNGQTSPEVVDNALDTGAPRTGASANTNNVIFATDRGGFIELDADRGTWKPIDSAWPSSQPRIQSIALYQSRVYALDTASESIVRFARSASSLGTGANWLKESANLSSSRGLMVDGSIYVLEPGGRVDLYTNGRKGTFSLATIEPVLTDATRLWTDATSTKIYLVDPGHQRIVVFSKTGKLLNQYQSDAWNNLRDVVVNEKTKTAYVLSGTTISSFTLLQ